MTLDEKLRALRDVIQEDVGKRGLARDPERNLLNACPDDFAAACRSIGEHSSPSVGIVTGFWIAQAECGETDGPLGTVFLALALDSLGMQVFSLTDHFCSQAVEAGFVKCERGRLDREAFFSTLPAGLSLVEKLDRLNQANREIPVWTLPSGNPARLGWWEEFGKRWDLVRLGLSHLIYIERVGPAEDARCYSMRGRDITEFMSPAHLLIDNCSDQRKQLVTIGIGDGGNEIGMGKIPVETIERNIPNGRTIACRVATDHLIVAGVSNWGAYALAAGIALVRGQKLDPALFDPERERAILAEMVARGPLVDGVTGRPTATVDGLDFDTYIRPLVRIGEIVAA
jgi:hypothetical protein